MTTPLLLVIKGQIRNRQWTWTDEAHLTYQNIHKLRQLVEAGASEPTANTRNPVGIAQELSIGSRGHGHCAKFTYLEYPASVASPLLPEE